ncbi:MAG: hypothetical protein E7666_09695 [Ruminococcaceae bacterium]|nr:hypothetical protein [Oscillospiraceae bacterium]
MIHKTLTLLLLLACFLFLLAGCIYYVPAPDAETQETESTDTSDGAGTTETTDTTEESQSESSSEDLSDSASAPARDNGYTSYH